MPPIQCAADSTALVCLLVAHLDGGNRLVCERRVGLLVTVLVIRGPVQLLAQTLQEWSEWQGSKNLIGALGLQRDEEDGIGGEVKDVGDLSEQKGVGEDWAEGRKTRKRRKNRRNSPNIRSRVIELRLQLPKSVEIWCFIRGRVTNNLLRGTGRIQLLHVAIASTALVVLEGCLKQALPSHAR